MKKDQLVVSHRRCQTDEAESDLVSMLLVNVDGQPLVPIVKKREAKEISTCVMPVEDAPMPNFVIWLSKNYFQSISLVFHVSYLSSDFPFYSLPQVGAVMSVNAALSIFLLRGTWH